MKKFDVKSRLPRLVTLRLLLILLFLGSATIDIHAAASNSIARVWNERALAALARYDGAVTG